MIAELMLDIYSEDGKTVVETRQLDPVSNPFGRTDFAYIRERSALVPQAEDIAKDQFYKTTSGAGYSAATLSSIWNSIFASVMEELARPLYI